MVRRARSLSIVVMIALASGLVWGQQPKRKPEPYVAPLLPAEQVWAVTLPAPPSAGAAMDDDQIYVPLTAIAPADGETSTVSARAQLLALDRETGVTRWRYSTATELPPVLSAGLLLVASANEVHAIDPRTGEWLWGVALEQPVRAPMAVHGALLVALIEGDELVALHVDRREIVWRRSIGTAGSPFMTTADGAIYVTTATGRTMCIRLSDGTLEWERQLQGALTEPAVDRDRLFVGSDANLGTLWALDPRNGETQWTWPGRMIGGGVVGTAVEKDTVYVVSKSNFILALNRGNGNQRWKKAVGTRPLLPPRVFSGAVAVTGLNPTLSTFTAKTGAAVSTWSGPEGAELQGAPLIQDPKPFRVSIIVVLRDGQVIGLRSTEMMFRQPPPGPLTALPGRALSRDRLPGEAEPTPAR